MTFPTIDNLEGDFVASLVSGNANVLCDFKERPAKVGDDALVLRELLIAGVAARCIRLWNNSRHLVVSRRIAKMPKFKTARQLCERLGWPVAVRASGGTTVVHRPGVLNVSLLTVDAERRTIRAGFDALCGIICRAAADIDIELAIGEIANAYCNGSHDIGWAGRKCGGTAALVRKHAGMTGRIFHASIVMQGDVAEDLAMMSAFETALGLARSYAPEHHCCLADALSERPVAPAGIASSADCDNSGVRALFGRAVLDR